LSFLPHGPQGWCAHDVRDGRVLVGCRSRRLREYWDIAVYDPLFQRFLLLPSITDDLLASVGLHNKDMHKSWASLIPSGGTEEETSFSVICWVFSKTRLAVFILSTKTSSAHWAAVKSNGWDDLGLPEEVDDCLNHPGQCVYGCFYWKVYCRSELLKLDMDTMEFSKYDLPLLVRLAQRPPSGRTRRAHRLPCRRGPLLSDSALHVRRSILSDEDSERSGGRR
jgi:hypothetical protein